MTFFEELGKTLTKVGEATVQKTKEVADITKLNAKILDIQNKLDKAYVEVGKKYVKLYPMNDEEDMKKVVNAVYKLEDELKGLQKQLQELKGIVKCDTCGFECDGDDIFCRRCGKELKKEEIIIDVEDDKEAADIEPEEMVEEAEVVVEEAVEVAEEVEDIQDTAE